MLKGFFFYSRFFFFVLTISVYLSKKKLNLPFKDLLYLPSQIGWYYGSQKSLSLLKLPRLLDGQYASHEIASTVI